MSSNEVTLTINLSDELLAKLLMAISPPQQSMGIPLQALMGMGARQQAIPAEKPKERAKVGFRVNNKEQK
jgi:hypothetical protein